MAAKIIYFGTNGCPGHYPLGIDVPLTHEEYKKWEECDNQSWIQRVQESPGRRLIQHYGKVYTVYSMPWSVDDARNMSHTNVFWEGIHPEQEMIDFIKKNEFLRKQFKME